MKPSKKKLKNPKTKSPQMESSPPTDPDLHQSSIPSPLVPTQTLISTSESRSRDLAWLSDAFSSLSVDQIESAYNEAGCDTFKTAGILGTHLEVEQKEEDLCNTGPTVSENKKLKNSSHKKVKKARPLLEAVSSGKVSSVSNDKIQTDVELKYSAEEAEGFLCSMLGENSDLGLGVVSDVLGMCGGDVKQALELLLELADESYCHQTREKCIPAAKNNLNCSQILCSIDCKNPPGSNIIPKQLGKRVPSTKKYPLKIDSGSSLERPKRDTHLMERMQSKTQLEKSLLESLFNVHKVPQIHTYASGNMDWGNVVKNLQSAPDLKFHSKAMSATRQKPKDGDGYHERETAQQNRELHSMAMSATSQKPKNGKGDGYHEFRAVAQQNWDLMKSFYQRAALEYSRGNGGHASLLAEQGRYYRDLARAEDERASLEIFEARNQSIKNTVTIDLHGQHVKEGISILKQHLLSFACKPVKYLRIITGCGEYAVGKGKMKRAVKSLATRENIEWSEENTGTIILKIKGRKDYKFQHCDGGEE